MKIPIERIIAEAAFNSAANTDANPSVIPLSKSESRDLSIFVTCL